MLPINQILLGDCTKELKALPDNSIDSVVTDPPYGLGRVKNLPALIQAWLAGEDGKEYQTNGFMQADWDTVPSPTMWREVFRVLKPGGYALVFAGTRTVDLMGLSLRLAGFEISESILWMFGSGFPKSKKILKPAHEPILFCYKPGKRENLNIDECRVGSHSYTEDQWQSKKNGSVTTKNTYGSFSGIQNSLPSGRYPSNVILSHHAECIPCGTKRVKGANHSGNASESYSHRSAQTVFPITKNRIVCHVAPDGTETIAAYQCHPSCPVAILDAQTAQMRASKSRGGDTVHRTGRSDGSVMMHQLDGDYHVPAEQYQDGGGSANASRFFLNLPPESPFIYQPKASRIDRTMGGKVENTHPTVKPVNLMAYLVRLVTPVNGIVLDPFAGSGSTALGCIRENRNYIGIELSPEYHAIALQRIEVELSKAKQLELDLDSSHTNAS